MLSEFQYFLGIFNSWSWKHPLLLGENLAGKIWSLTAGLGTWNSQFTFVSVYVLLHGKVVSCLYFRSEKSNQSVAFGYKLFAEWGSGSRLLNFRSYSQCCWSRSKALRYVCFLGLQDPNPSLFVRIRIRILPSSTNKVIKNLISINLWLLYDFLFLEIDVNVSLRSE